MAKETTGPISSQQIELFEDAANEINQGIIHLKNAQIRMGKLAGTLPDNITEEGAQSAKKLIDALKDFVETYDLIEKTKIGNYPEQTFKATLSGIKTREQAEDILSWFCGQGEQDYGTWVDMQEKFPNITTDCKKGIRKTPDGYDYPVITHEE